jgi:hypothetical protein
MIHTMNLKFINQYNLSISLPLHFYAAAQQGRYDQFT